MGQYFPVRLEQARLLSSLLYGTWAMLVLSLPAYTQLMRFHGNGPCGETRAKKEPIITDFPLDYLAI